MRLLCPTCATSATGDVQLLQFIPVIRVPSVFEPVRSRLRSGGLLGTWRAVLVERDRRCLPIGQVASSGGGRGDLAVQVGQVVGDDVAGGVAPGAGADAVARVDRGGAQVSVPGPRAQCRRDIVREHLAERVGAGEAAEVATVGESRCW